MADDERGREPTGAAQLAPVPDTDTIEATADRPGRDLPEESSYAMRLAEGSYRWYRDHAIRSRAAYKASETALLVVSAAVPVSGVVMPDAATVPAILGGVVVVLAGLRSVFHWQDNYLRFSQAREAVEAERRLYETGAMPYDDRATRDQILAAAVTRIEHAEMNNWLKIAAARPKP